MVKELERAIKALKRLPEKRQLEISKKLMLEVGVDSDALRNLGQLVEWSFWDDPKEDVYQEYVDNK